MGCTFQFFAPAPMIQTMKSMKEQIRCSLIEFRPTYTIAQHFGKQRMSIVKDMQPSFAPSSVDELPTNTATTNNNANTNNNQDTSLNDAADKNSKTPSNNGYDENSNLMALKFCLAYILKMIIDSRNTDDCNTGVNEEALATVPATTISEQQMKSSSSPTSPVAKYDLVVNTGYIYYDYRKAESEPICFGFDQTWQFSSSDGDNGAAPTFFKQWQHRHQQHGHDVGSGRVELFISQSCATTDFKR